MTTFIVTHDIDTSRETTEVEAQSFAGDTANGITFYDERGQACAWFEAHRVYKVVQKTENNAPITELNPRQAHAEAVRETVLTAVRDTPPASHDDALTRRCRPTASPGCAATTPSPSCTRTAATAR